MALFATGLLNAPETCFLFKLAHKVNTDITKKLCWSFAITGLKPGLMKIKFKQVDFSNHKLTTTVLLADVLVVFQTVDRFYRFSGV